jgi:RimJ/RimL family protein N-acetyltransferase
MHNNFPMKRIFIKSGMKFEARFKKHVVFQKEYIDVVYYAIFKSPKYF